MSSWQQHLKRISSFLKPGPEIWWHNVEGGYNFHNGSDAPSNRDEGPSLSHFRHRNLQEVVSKKHLPLEEIRAQDVQIPTPYITLYNENGDFSGRHVCNENVPEDRSDEEMETEFDTEPTQTYNEILHEENDVEENQDARENIPQTPHHQYESKLATALCRALGE